MMTHSFYKRLALGMALLVCAVALGSFFFSDPDRITYHTEPASRGSIDVSVNGVGEVHAAQLVTVGAQVSGKIENLYVSLGDYVKKNDVIAIIDATTQSSELETRKSRLKTYKAQLVNHIIAANIANAQYKREQSLYAQDSTSRQDLETAEKTQAQARAELEATKSLIAQEEVAVAKATADLGYTRILAPIEGTIVSLPVEIGQTVNANQTTPTIALLADLNRMEIKVHLSEGDITKVAKDMPVSFYILSEPEQKYRSFLHSIDPAHTSLTDEAESSGRRSSSSDNAVYYYGRLLAENSSGKLRIGMTTHCTISIAKADGVLRIPGVAIKQKNGKAYVRVLEGGTPVSRTITIGLADSMFTEVTSGIEEGEQVVLAEMTQAEIDAQIKKRQR